MTEIFFLTQIERLKRRFGERHFDPEFIKLCASEVKSMSDLGLQRAADVWIGNRPAHKPPLLADFREARLNEEKLRFDRETKMVNQTLTEPARQSGLKQILKEQYGNVKSVVEAIEFLTFKKRLEEADKGPPDGAA